MIVEVTNWKTLQGRRDLKTPYWFKFEHQLVLNAASLTLGARELLAYLYVMSICSESSQSRVFISKPHHHAFGRQSWDAFVAGCKSLQENKLLKVVRATSVQDLNGICSESVQDLNGICSESVQDLNGICAPDLDVEVDKKNTIAAEPIGSEVQSFQSQVEETSEQATFDYDHETVNTPPEERPLPKLAQIWNQHASPVLPRVKLCSATRRKHALNRMKEHPQEEFWTDLIWKLNRYDWCLGKSERGWKANFDWFIKPATIEKLVEGQYERGSKTGTQDRHWWVRQQEEEAAKNGE